MIVALVQVVVVLFLGGGTFLVYRVARRRRSAEPTSGPARRLSSFTLESVATAVGLIAIVLAVTLKLT